MRRLARTVADLDSVGGGGDGDGAGLEAIGVGNDVVGAGPGVIEIDHLQEALLLRCQREFLLGAVQ